MALFSISDLHLSLGVDKPMDIFGGNWENYIEKLFDNWHKTVSSDDVVIMPGDFCWAMYLEESKNDFDFLNSLPGLKILLKGNHDYWWDTATKVKKYLKDNCYKNIELLQNNSYMYNDTAICGTRFWLCPGAASFSGEDKKIYQRELGRAELSLKDAVKKNPKEILFFMHYPPFSSIQNIDSDFCELMKKYNVTRVFYGHIHGTAQSYAFVGEHKDIKFDLVSCDYLDFTPKKII